MAEFVTLQENPKIKEYQEKLHGLRSDGVNKITEIKQAIAKVKKNPMIEYDKKPQILADYKKQLEEAKSVAKKNEAQDKILTKEAVAYANLAAKDYIKTVNATENEKIKTEKANFAQEIRKIKAEGNARIENAKSPSEKETARYELKTSLFDEKNKSQTIIERCRDAKKQAFTDHVTINRGLRNEKSNFIEDAQLGFINYKNSFKLSKFFLDNGLYIAIAIFFVVCIIIAPAIGAGNLLTLPNIFTILEQSSTRMFYALGVAGLILLAGTDLSVGRMVAMGSVVTGLILHPGTNIVKFFNMGPWNFTAFPMGVRLIFALLLSILLCTAFCAFAGVFTAKLKIHPFISTLASQLIIYGLLFFGTTGTPVGSIDSSVKDLIGGRWVLGIINGELVTFPKLIIPAIIAIIVAWFIWNKTTF